MNEKKVDQYVKFYSNKTGEVVELTEDLMEKVNQCDNPCNEMINFCCSTTIPDGFTINIDPVMTQICCDTSQTICCLEPQTTTCEVPNPCDGTLTCPVEIQAVRLVGCARFLINIGSLTPTDGSGACFICCEETVCVNQIIGFTCGKTPPCEPCFDIPFNAFGFRISTDDCGRTVVTIEGFINIRFLGCNS